MIPLLREVALGVVLEKQGRRSPWICHHFVGSFCSSFENFDKSSANCAGSTLSMRTCQGCPARHITLLARLLSRGSGVLVREGMGTVRGCGPEQCSGVSVWPLCPGRVPLPLPLCSWWVHCTPPSWLVPIQWMVLPSSPYDPWESETLDEWSSCRAGAWAKSREKLGKISIFLSFAGYQRADSGALVSLVATAVVSPLGCQGISILLECIHSFVTQAGCWENGLLNVCRG